MFRSDRIFIGVVHVTRPSGGGYREISETDQQLVTDLFTFLESGWHPQAHLRDSLSGLSATAAMLRVPASSMVFRCEIVSGRDAVAGRKSVFVQIARPLGRRAGCHPIDDKSTPRFRPLPRIVRHLMDDKTAGAGHLGRIAQFLMYARGGGVMQCLLAGLPFCAL